MSLDNIQLPGSLCLSLFKNSLVDLQLNHPGLVPLSKMKIDFLGGNDKDILFISTDLENKYMAEDEMIFLNDLLKACNFTMADIAFINFSSLKEITFNEINEQFAPKKILIFGITARELVLPFSIPIFQVQKFQEQVFLMCPALSEILHNKELKKLLWNSLQKIFNIQKNK